MRLLLDRNADPNAVDKNKWTPLSLAWTTEVERLLLANGAIPDEEVKSTEGGIEKCEDDM